MSNHIAERDLLRAVDGELSKRESANINEHLAGCWMCRTRLSDLEKSIHEFVHVHINDFKSHIGEIDGPRALLRARIADLERAERRSWRDALSLQLWRVSLYFAAVLIVVAFIVFPRPRAHRDVSRITVPEVLSKAASSEEIQLRRAQQPVTYQKVQIRVGGKGYDHAIYRDIKNSRHADTVQSVAQPMSERDADRALHPIEQAFTEANLDWASPLSPTRLSGWRSGLNVRSDRVEEGQTLTQISTATPDGPIAEATVKFRNADYHPVSETLRLRDNRVVEIAELDYKVVELSQLNASVFEPRTPQLAISEASIAGVSLELTVIQGLDRVNAFMGDQVSVEHNRGSIDVRGVVDSKQRRDEIVTALAPALGSPALKLDIEVPGAAARAKKNSAHESIEGIEGFQRAPADNSLREFFAKNSSTGKTTDEEVEKFTDEVSLHSHAARANALALKKIAEQFTPDDLGSMTAEEHRQWRAMLQSHALAVLKETRLMRGSLEPIFGANSEDKPPLISDLKSDADLVYAAAKLSDLASSNDSAVWHSFAASTEASNVTLVCLPEFWESLLDAEILAQEISESTKFEKSRFKGSVAQST